MGLYIQFGSNINKKGSDLSSQILLTDSESDSKQGFKTIWGDFEKKTEYRFSWTIISFKFYLTVNLSKRTD